MRLTQVEIAGVLDITDRQVRNLGLPRTEDGYQVRDCVRHYLRLKVDEAVRRVEARSSGDDDADTRLTAARAAREELKLEREALRSVDIEEFRDALEIVLGAVAQRIDKMDGEWHLRILNIENPATARLRLEEIKRTLLSTLSSAAERLEVSDAGGDDLMRSEEETVIEPEAQPHGGWLKRTRVV